MTSLASKEIIGFLKQVSASRFSSIRLRYEHDELTGTHIVEVSPRSFALSDKDFAKLQFEFVNQFLGKYPCEDICFVTENDLIRVSNPCFDSDTLKNQSRHFSEFDNYWTELLAGLLDEFSIQWEHEFSKKTWIQTVREREAVQCNAIRVNILSDVKLSYFRTGVVGPSSINFFRGVLLEKSQPAKLPSEDSTYMAA